MQNEPIEVTLRVTAVFEMLGVPYLIGGSLASALYGMVRTTQDSDIVAEMQLVHLQPFVSALQDEFYVDDEMIADAIQRYGSFSIIHRSTMFKVDVFVPRPRPFVQSQLSRARDRFSPSTPRSAPTLPAPKTPSSPSWSSIGWAAKSPNASGATCSA